MDISRIAGVLMTISAGVGSGACVVDEIPACPGQCFEYTVEYEIPTSCGNAVGDDFDIPFTGTNPDGYRGRVCFNSSAVPDVMAAIEHLESGGQLSDLSEAIQSAYISTVNAVKDDLQTQCITAAAGQCTDEAQVCTGIAANMYEQLVVDESCVLALGGVEPVPVGPGEACEFSPVEQGTGSAESGDHCTEATTGDDGGTAGADETTGDTTGMMLGPFGDIDTLVRCDRKSACEVDRELVSNLSTHFEVFGQERVTLTIVDKQAQCGPGARIGGLDPREQTAELADALGLRNGDIIRELEAITLVDMSAAMDALASLLEDPSTTIVVQRPAGSRCETVVVDIDVL